MNRLEEARKIINEVDKEIVALFQKRMQAVEDVILYKLENNMPILDSSREKQVIEKNCAYITEEKYIESYKEFIQNLMDTSKRYQATIINKGVVAYQGTMGAFSHIASKKVFPDSKLKSFATFEDVFKAVADGAAAYGVIPFENSFTGEVGEVLDLLLKYDCHISGIYDLKIDQNLLGLKNAEIKDIEKVYSHHQALSQCKTFLKGTNFEAIPYPNTALAAKFVSEAGDIHKAAIASRETAELYGLKILVENINTSIENTTRFIILTKKLEEKGDRFNLLFTVDHNAGQLAHIIQIVAEHGFNMESIKSRSLHNLPWQYFFYVEIVGELKAQKTKDLIEAMRKNCKDLKILGSYSVKQ